jgi:hypothetical protein
MNGVTRAADIDAGSGTNGLQTIGFNVSARKHSPDAAYFTDALYEYGSGSWTCANKHYWPEDDSELDFYAYAPATSDQITAHADYKTFAVKPATTASTQVDLVFANTNQKKKSTDNAGITINFRHAESKVVIMLMNSNSSLKFTIGEVTIGNVKDRGVFTYQSGSSTANTDGRNLGQLDYDDWAWTSVENTTYTQTVADGTIYSTSTAKQAGVDMILIPQQLTTASVYSGDGTGATFNASYITTQLKIQNAVNDDYIVGTSGFVTALWPLPATKWEPGKKYIYTIDLAGGGYFTTNQDAGEDALDPILDGALIKFVTVTVDDWADGGNAAVGMLP